MLKVFEICIKKKINNIIYVHTKIKNNEKKNTEKTT